MSDSPRRDLLVGLFVLAGLAAIAYLSLSVGGVTYRGSGGLHVFATFEEIGGLKPRAPVVVGGVKVGQVVSIRLATDLRPRVDMDIDRDLELPADTSASILTSGLLGDQYVALEPGGEDTLLKSGDQIHYTQSAFVLERMIGRVVQDLGADSSE